MKVKKICIAIFAFIMLFLCACSPELPPPTDLPPPPNPDWPDGVTEELSKHDLKAFSLSEYMTPIWDDGGIAYTETVFVVAERSGEIAPISLLYPAKQIISVRSFGLDILYEEATDYSLTFDGKLQVKKDGTIPAIDFADVYFDEYDPSNSDSTKLVFGSGAQLTKEAQNGAKGFTEWQVAVTYKHSAVWPSKPVAGRKSTFAISNEKLENDKTFKIASLGDSISQGWTASGYEHVDLLPNMPPYFDLLTMQIEENFPEADVQALNVSVAGKTANWAIVEEPAVMARVTDFNPDLVIVAFGMNDGVGTRAMTYMARIRTNIEQIKAACPDAEIVLISSMPPNEAVVSWTGEPMGKHHREYSAVLETLSRQYSGVAVCDMMELFDNVMTSKKYADLSSNNINHPNDYGHRLYAQAVYKTIFG